MLRSLVAAILAFSPSALAAAEPAARSADFFETKIRPVLVERCVDCHSGDEPESGLRVDTLAGLVRGGSRGPAIVIGKPEESLLVRAIRHGELLKMPAKEKLPAAEIADIVRWIEAGAAWPNEKPPEVTQPAAGGEPVWTKEQKSFWSFQPPVAAPLPAVKNEGWLRSPLDAFVLARLEAAGLSPTTQAGKRTLIRRATFDLIGLPPTPEEVEAFLADDSPDAFARVVERLLASPRYGERWGRHWLDVARYADSNGLDENLAYANAFRYRDYVVGAFNRDLPFDQFVREQIAGDLLADAPTASGQFDRITATGFLSLGAKMLAEDDPVKMQMDIIDEQIDTVGRAFMGMTLGCARCHDHKFDPISTRDYYALAGIFKSTKAMENFSVVARWQEVPLATEEALEARQRQADRVTLFNNEIKRVVDENSGIVLAAARRHVGDYLLAARERIHMQRLLAKTQPIADDGDGTQQPGVQVIEAEDYVRGNVQRNVSTYGKGIGVLVNQGEIPNFAVYYVNIPAEGMYQLDLRYAAASARPCKLFINGELVKWDAAENVTGSWNPDGQKWFVEGFFQLKKENVVKLEQPKFFPHIDKLLFAPAPAEVQVESFEPLDVDYEPLQQFVEQWAELLQPERDTTGVLNNWLAVNSSEARETAERIGARFAQVEDRWQKTQMDNDKTERLDDDSEESLRRLLYDENGPFAAPDGLEGRFPEEVQSRLAKLRLDAQSLERMMPELPTAMAVADEKPQNVPVHIRGSHLTLGAVVERRLPRVLTRGEQPAIGDDGSGRRELAEWLASPEHPLTARVMANRIWLWHFGEGLVRSPDNFGRLGERPTHPELLDWLAVHFVESGWSIKAMHRLILLSSTWQQSIDADARTVELDPENRLWGRMNRRRLDAEAIRDSLLAVAGSLDDEMGGSLLPTKNRAYVTSTANVDPVVYVSDRRSIYLPVVRSALYDVFQAFDFADPSVLNGQRQTTTVAPQALFMLNSRLVAGQSLKMAERLFEEEPSDAAARVGRAWQLAYNRHPTDDEAACALQYVESYREKYRQAFPDRSEADLRAWQSLCRAVMGANEFVYVE